MKIELEIVDWYKKNKRDLPWRNTKNPYEIWISEIILQQTRVNQAINYYYNFLENFPNVSMLANANEHDVLKVWQGLGYYSRARNLHSSAKFIMNELKGVFPQSYQELLRLKGIGNYTAAAIASFAYNEKVAVVDGNVFRVLSRIFGESTPVNSTKGKKLFFDLASELLSTQEPYIFNQAIMEFGAVLCSPKKPDCLNCRINSKCLAFNQRSIELYPVKNKLQNKKNRFLNYLFIVDKGHTFLKKRGSNDIWQGLYEFPLIEPSTTLDLESVINLVEWQYFFADSKLKSNAFSSRIIHQLTHQQLDIRFIAIEIEYLSPNSILLQEIFVRVPLNELSIFPVPKPIENYINQL